MFGELLMRVLLLMLAACGSSATATAKAILPNTEQACLRAVRCQVFAEYEFSQCVACLEHADQILLAKLRAEWGDLPPLEQVDCETLRYVCDEMTNIAQCVRERWEWHDT